jgi:Helix-turn-helix domain
VEPGIGPTLRRARNRRKVGLAEVEETTKIRVRYLKAIEDEEWDALPGEAYTRSFIRTYASYLGLDGPRLVEEYRQQLGDALGEEQPLHHEPAPLPSRRPMRAPRVPGRVWTGIVVAALIGALVVVGLTSGEEGGGGAASSTRRTGSVGPAATSAHIAAKGRRRTVALRLSARAEVWVCVLDASGRPLVDGQILAPGAEEGPFHSSSFTVAFGNGEIAMKIDGQKASIPSTSSPIGFAIDSEGNVKPLSEGERPTCA